MSDPKVSRYNENHNHDFRVSIDIPPDQIAYDITGKTVQLFTYMKENRNAFAFLFEDEYYLLPVEHIRHVSKTSAYFIHPHVGKLPHTEYNPSISDGGDRPYFVTNDPQVDFKTLGFFKYPKNGVISLKYIDRYVFPNVILKLYKSKTFISGIRSGEIMESAKYDMYKISRVKNTNKLSNPSIFSKLFSRKKKGGCKSKKMVYGKSVSALTSKRNKSNKKRNKTERK